MRSGYKIAELTQYFLVVTAIFTNNSTHTLITR